MRRLIPAFTILLLSTAPASAQQQPDDVTVHTIGIDQQELDAPTLEPMPEANQAPPQAVIKVVPKPDISPKQGAVPAPSVIKVEPKVATGPAVRKPTAAKPSPKTPEAEAQARAEAVALMMENITPYNVVTLQGLNKVTGKISKLEGPLGTVMRFGNLEVIARRCWKAPPEETPENAGLIEIRELKPEEGAQLVFIGWMFSSSPGLSGLEHPVYDVNILNCEASEHPEEAGEKKSEAEEIVKKEVPKETKKEAKPPVKSPAQAQQKPAQPKKKPVTPPTTAQPGLQ